MSQSAKILHIFDEEKITKSSIDLFKKLTDYDQTFIVITDSKAKSSTAPQTDMKVQLLPRSSDLVGELKRLIENYDVIFLQALSFDKAKAITASKFDKKVFIWGLWGYELYNIFGYFNPQSKQDLSNFRGEKTALIDRVRDFYTFNIIYKKAVKKIDICLFLSEKDFRILSESLPHNAVWMTGCYQTIENIYGLQRNFEIQGDSILIGNSSTPSNRHEYVFGLLEQAKLKNRQIIVPLNYGDFDYQKEIVSKGEKLFKQQFRPLLTFMEIDSYLEEIKTASQVIMAHKRQQGFGSIVMMLLGGAKVYLSRKSPLFDWFKDLEIIIYCVEQDLPAELSRPLSDREKNYNRQILTAYLSEESVLARLKQVFDKANTISKSLLG